MKGYLYAHILLCLLDVQCLICFDGIKEYQIKWKIIDPPPGKTHRISLPNCVFRGSRAGWMGAIPPKTLRRIQVTPDLGDEAPEQRYSRWAGHGGVVSCVSLSSSFPGASLPRCLSRAASLCFSDRPPAPTLCSSRSPPPTVAPSLRRCNQPSRIQIWAGDDYRSGSPRRGLNAGTGPP